MAIFKVTGSIRSTDGWIYTRTHVTEAVSEDEAKNHFAWHFVVRKKNHEVEFPFGKIDFKSIKVMKGEVKMENVSLWKILKAKLEGRNIPVTDSYAKELRKQFKVYRVNIDNEKLIDKIADYVNDENKKREARIMSVKEENANMNMVEIIVNMLLKHGVTVDHPKDEDDSYFIYTQKGECEVTAKNALLMGRDLYKKANVLFNQFQANYFKGELIKLFKPEGNDNVVTCAEEVHAYYGEGDGHINQAFLDGIDRTMENQDHVLDSTWSQRKFGDTKTELPKLEPVNMYPATLFDPVNQREEECVVRFMRAGDKFLGTICFRPEGWKTFSDVRGDFKNRFRTIWEFEPRRYKSPIIRVRKQAGKDDIYSLGGNEGVDATLRAIYKLLVQWQKDEIKRKEIREARAQYRMNRRYVDGKKK